MKKNKQQLYQVLLLTAMVTVCMGLFFSCSKDDTKPANRIEGIALDAITFEPLTGAIVSLEPADDTKSSSPIAETVVDNNGIYVFENIKTAVYKLIITKENYKTMVVNNVDLNEGEPFVAFLPVTNDITTPVGGITGRIFDNKGNPLEEANLAISAQNEAITNGYFTSTTSNQKGQYYIAAVPLQSTNEFKVRCMRTGYDIKVEQNIIMGENEMMVVDFHLKTETPAQVLFHEGFETTDHTWEKTGFWHIHDGSTIYNQAYPDYVKLAPNDESEGRIPNANKGSRMAWYGDPETGNFMGPQRSNDNQLSGGTSQSSNRGEMISPPISLGNLNQASLNFWTWFEIESVNPNASGYDLMEIYVIDTANDSQTLIGKLNPYTDPVLPDRRALAFTSGGFNQNPVWKYIEFDLSSFVGSTIKLRFRFDTRDHLYNGFRGWFVDEIRVTDKAAAEAKSMPDPDRPLMERE